jgi:hypothetical protein
VQVTHRDIGCFGIGGLIGASAMGWALAQSTNDSQSVKFSAAVNPWTITNDASPIKAGQYLTIERTGDRVDSIHVDVRELCRAGK